MKTNKKSSTPALALLATGIVFGDIGTSPLYTLQGAFDSTHGVPPTVENILGGCSCIFWALMIIVTLKYVSFILRVTNKNEGGIMAMLALASSAIKHKPHLQRWIIILGLVGVTLFYGDAVLTPAISVLSAVEGLSVGSNDFSAYTVPIAVVILFLLFCFQWRGTAQIGRFFGPICVIWFCSIALIGIWNIIQYPAILEALNPLCAIRFLIIHHLESLYILGFVLLAFTGAEALYADVGHFGQKAIRLAWFLIFPCLILSYFGQGALLIQTPHAISNPFFLACPHWALYPMVILATAATIIASQATISGAYSMTSQAIQLHYLPRMEVRHTSSEEMGQIYIPVINWIVLVAVLLTVITFRSAENLASAYGVAVCGTMLTTTLLAFFVMRYNWKYSLGLSLAIIFPFAIVDLTFFSAGILKIFSGGWFPLCIAFCVFVLIRTWRNGRKVLLTHRRETSDSLAHFLQKLFSSSKNPITRVAGTAIFFCHDLNVVPRAFQRNLKHNKILHQHVIFLNLSEEDSPFISDAERIQFSPLIDNCYILTLRFGFKQDPRILKALRLCVKQGYDFIAHEDLSFFFSQETFLLKRHKHNMPLWRKRLFAFLARNQRNAADFFHLPSDSVMLLGTQIEF